jgi:hypothetical protein
MQILTSMIKLMFKFIQNKASPNNLNIKFICINDRFAYYHQTPRQQT